MLQSFRQLAEHAATGVSRRQFLGGMGRVAMVLAAAAGGLLAAPLASQGARPFRGTCGFDSGVECRGQPVGSSCAGGAGRCRALEKKGDTGCFCYVKGER
jgi:hypothetical protein